MTNNNCRVVSQSNQQREYKVNLRDIQRKLLLCRQALTTALATSRQILFEAPATVFRYAREGRARWLRELGLRHRYEDRRQCARERHVRQGCAPALLTKTQAPRLRGNAMCSHAVLCTSQR